MKKLLRYTFAAVAAVAAISCAKEFDRLEMGNPKPRHEVTISLPATKTALDENGKTVWEAGDTLIFTDGAAKDTVVIPEDQAGKGTVTLSTSFDGKIWAIYPHTAAGEKAITDTTLNVVIPQDQDGLFSSSNICCAMSEPNEDGSYTVAMRNVTALLAFEIPDGIDAVILNAAGNALTGNVEVDLRNGDPTVVATSTGGIVTIDVAGLGGKYYVAVAPGEYNAGFRATAITLEGKFQSFVTKGAKTLKVNDMANLGTIGGELSGLNGDGSEANPYKITNLAELTAFAYTVNIGNDYEGMYIKLDGDIEGTLTTPIGYYIDASRQSSFKGNFDGSDKTINIAIDGQFCKSEMCLGLFGRAVGPATFKNVKVSGTAKGSGDYVAGVVGSSVGTAADTIRFENCSSSVKVNGKYRCGGITGYASYVVFDNCTNSGEVCGTQNVGGIVGYAYQIPMSNCNNSGNIVSTADGGYYHGIIGGYYTYGKLSDTAYDAARTFAKSQYGTGGLAGWAQNVTMTECGNAGTVSGVSKVGGLAGTGYWSTFKQCTNNAAITADECAGGIVGWIYAQSNANTCTNNAPITAKYIVGGIAGFSNGLYSTTGNSNFTSCVNNGKITATGSTKSNENTITFNNGSFAGGIIGHIREFYYSSGSKRTLTYCTSCTNNADIEAAGAYVGGIAGLDFAQSGNTHSDFNYCENKGKITALSGVGGILGGYCSRYTHGTKNIKNCSNSGNLSTLTKDKETRLGGIVGYFQPIYPSASQTASTYMNTLHNCYNKGEVKALADSSGYVGGIVGRAAHLTTYATYSAGQVVNADGKEFKANTGAVIGVANAPVNLAHAYYVTTTLEPIGAKSASGVTISSATVSPCDANGELAGAVTISGTDYYNAVDALNAWRNIQSTPSSWSTWKAGPEFEK